MRTSPKVWLLQLLCCVLLLAGGVSVFAQNTAEEDELLQILQHALQENYDLLQENHYSPYYMAYQVNETTEHHISANFGHIYDNSSTKSAFLTIEIRVGNPETDNFHYLSFQNLRLVKKIVMPLDHDSVMIGKILRQETQHAYEEAVLQYIDNQTNRILFKKDDEKFHPFLIGGYDRYYDPPILETHWDYDDWTQKLRHCTEEAALFPHLTEASADLTFRINRKYLITTENRSIVENSTSATLRLNMEGLTSENEVEHIERQFFAFYPEQLPDADVLQQEMREMEIQLSEVLHASNENMNEGTSNVPVLLSEKAASVLAHHLFGHTLENARTADIISLEKVIPNEFSIICDPTVTEYAGNHLSSSYKFDDEGIKSQRVTLFSQGEHKQMLSTRTQDPSTKDPSPNGHARGNNYTPAAKQSNLLISTSKPKSFDQLADILQTEAQQQNVDYGLYVEEVEIRCDTSKNKIYLYPTVCYQFFTSGKHPDEMVRDIVISGTPQQWLTNLIGGGEKPGSVSILCHHQNDEVTTHCCSPALLFRQAEVSHRTPTTRKRIVSQIAAPAFDNLDRISDLFFQTAQNEWAVDQKELSIGEEKEPYYQDFTMTDAHIFTVEASEGNLCYSNEKLVRKLVPMVLLGSDKFNNEIVFTGESEPPAIHPMSTDNSAQAFARDFRQATETEYLKSVKQWEKKKKYMEQFGFQELDDRSKADVTQSYDEAEPDYPTLNNLEHFAREVSAALAKHDFLSRSGINIYIMMGNAYFWSSEKTTYSRPVSIIGVQIYGAVERTGKEYKDTKTLFLPCTDSLFSSQQIQNEINKLALHLQNVKLSGTEVNGYYYSGPVLIEGEAVGQILVAAFLGRNHNLLANKEFFSSTEEKRWRGDYHFENHLDQIITSKQISVTANKSGDTFDKATFVRHEKTDAEGVETQETEIIRDGELITLMGNRNVTKATPYSNGFQQLSIHNEGCFATRGASRIDFEHKKKLPHAKLKQALLKEAKKQGCRYAFILRQFFDPTMQNVQESTPYAIDLLQLYRVDVRTGEEVPLLGGVRLPYMFRVLDNILYVSDIQAAFPVMMQVHGAKGSRDFPFAGVPTCIVAPDGILLKSALLYHP